VLWAKGSVMNCPNYGKQNDDNWPITVNDEIKRGGCQDCWESESDAAWWDAVDSLAVWWNNPDSLIAYCEED
jgi:hypothetical protein